MGGWWASLRKVTVELEALADKKRPRGERGRTWGPKNREYEGPEGVEGASAGPGWKDCERGVMGVGET